MRCARSSKNKNGVGEKSANKRERAFIKLELYLAKLVLANPRAYKGPRRVWGKKKIATRCEFEEDTTSGAVIAGNEINSLPMMSGDRMQLLV